jgi:threonine/homoserine/homoserine lactone efflux protein
VKWIGAAYLLYTGVQMLRSRASTAATNDAAEKPLLSLRQVFWQGVFTNALNPKVALFFLAFLPSKALAFIVLGLIFISTGTIWGLGTAVVAAKAASRVRQSGQAIVWMNRALGGVFIYLGIRVAMLETR